MAQRQLSPKQLLKQRRKRRDMRKNLKRRMRNRAVRTRMKNVIKAFKKMLEEFRSAVQSGKTSQELEDMRAKLDAQLKLLYKVIDMAASKGVIHKNEAARRKSRLAQQYSKILKQYQVA